jgi:hypothetical protein
MSSKNGDGRRTDTPSPDERYEEFARKNGAGHKKVEEALDDLDKLVRELEESSEQEPAGK